MKNVTFVLVLMVISVFQTGCCGSFGRDTEVYIAGLFKYNNGMDYSENYYVPSGYLSDRNFAIWNGPTNHKRVGKAIAVKGGYFLGPPLTHGNSFIYFTFTFDDLINERVPEDWRSHWEDYVLADSVFEEFRMIYGSKCKDNMGVPAYCAECENTYSVDTSELNRMIIDGSIWKYTYSRLDF